MQLSWSIPYLIYEELVNFVADGLEHWWGKEGRDVGLNEGQLFSQAKQKVGDGGSHL